MLHISVSVGVPLHVPPFLSLIFLSLKFVLSPPPQVLEHSPSTHSAHSQSTNSWIVQVNCGNGRKKLPRQYENILSLLPGQSSTLHFSVRKDGPVHALPPFLASTFWVLVMFLAPVPHGLGHSPMIHLFQIQSTIKGYSNSNAIDLKHKIFWIPILNILWII